MSNRVDCVVFVETSMSMVQLRNTYARLSISPWETRADSVRLACFVEFADEAAVTRVRALQLQDTSLHVVSRSPQLVAHYLSIVQPAQPLPPFLPTPSSSANNLHARQVKQEPRDDRRLLKRSSEGEIASSTESTPRKKARRSEKSGSGKHSISRSHDSDTHSSLTADPRTPRAAGKSPLSLSTMTRHVSGKENDARAQEIQTYLSSRRTLALPRRKDVGRPSPDATPVAHRAANAKAPSQVARASSVLERPTVVTQVEERVNNKPQLDTLDAGQLAQTTSALQGAPIASPIITLVYNGRPVNCDLRKLEEDPNKIIAVLKAVASCSPERDKWMIVAAQYRARGNFNAAISVLDAMVEAMTSQPVSLSKTDLKPAFLMLSSCHRDIVAQGPSENGAFHVRRATECLQQVYGVDVPRSQVTSEFAEARARSCMNLPGLLTTSPDSELGAAHARECLADAGNLPRERSAHEPSPSRPVSATTKLHDSRRGSDNSSPIVPDPQRDESDRGRSRTNSRSYSERDKHVEMLEREIHALRDRATENTAALYSVRTAKRKLEDELVAEHTARRRLEREAEGTTGELTRTREELARAREDVARLRDELDRARRGEESALEQAAAEVASRRAAEGRVEVLKEELGRLRNEVTRARTEGREAAEEGREAERRAKETFAKLGALFVRAGRGELPLSLGLDGGGEPRRDDCDVHTTPASQRSTWEEERRSRSASGSGRGWRTAAG